MEKETVDKETETIDKKTEEKMRALGFTLNIDTVSIEYKKTTYYREEDTDNFIRSDIILSDNVFGGVTLNIRMCGYYSRLFPQTQLAWQLDTWGDGIKIIERYLAFSTYTEAYTYMVTISLQGENNDV